MTVKRKMKHETWNANVGEESCLSVCVSFVVDVQCFFFCRDDYKRFTCLNDQDWVFHVCSHVVHENGQHRILEQCMCSCTTRATVVAGMVQQFQHQQLNMRWFNNIETMYLGEDPWQKLIVEDQEYRVRDERRIS